MVSVRDEVKERHQRRSRGKRGRRGKNPPPPLAGGGWGEGATPAPRPPPPNPLPQGEGEYFSLLPCPCLYPRLCLYPCPLQPRPSPCHAEDRHRRRRHLHRPGRGGRQRPLHIGKDRIHPGRPVDRRDGRPRPSGRTPAPVPQPTPRADRAHRAWHHGRHQCAARTQGRQGRSAHHRRPPRRHRNARGPEGRPLQPPHATAGTACAARVAARRDGAHARRRHDRDTARPRLARHLDRGAETCRRGSRRGVLSARLPRSAP